ncbi:myoD family inhibitor-like [Sphaerodactylus townsendi]|uniref:myoD family inhibitor-like n=1 Tax=Sphaerodactylus townsendi TaxID=933632 RepID=UPI002025D7E6|nr:myoD family inhibitor-like [Sphaerodactylus townsendi]
MSAVNSDIPGGTDGRNAESNRGTTDSPKVTLSSELPRPANPGITSFPFHQEKVPLHPIYTNGFGVARGGSVRQQQPQMPGKQHVGSTASVCSKSSRKSCKSTASQIQEEAKDDCCAHCALACLFCEFISLCSLALDCLGCGGCLEVCCSRDGGESLGECCCCGEAGAGNCSCGCGCGMLQDCCGSSDCLEICMECCSICFPA